MANSAERRVTDTDTARARTHCRTVVRHGMVAIGIMAIGLRGQVTMETVAIGGTMGKQLVAWTTLDKAYR